jgi:hypothetical protein
MDKPELEPMYLSDDEIDVRPYRARFNEDTEVVEYLSDDAMTVRPLTIYRQPLVDYDTDSVDDISSPAKKPKLVAVPKDTQI